MSKNKRKIHIYKTPCTECGNIIETSSNQRKYCEQCRLGKKKALADTYFRETQLVPEIRLKRLIVMATNRANTKSLPINIDLEYILGLYYENDGCCALTGQKLDLRPYGDKGQVNPQAPSLDRITPSLGYIKGNVRIITYHMNIALSDFGTDEFDQLIRNYIEFGGLR